MKVSIQTNIKNELDIIEWIFYHLFIMKFDHIYIYDNESEFKIKNYLEIYPILSKHLTIIYVNSENIKFTIKKYCRKHYQINYIKESDFTLFLDGDEYLCLKSHNNIKELLNDNKYKNFNTILFNWKIFGNLNQLTKPKNYVLENYINYNDNYELGSLNSHFKVLVKNINITDCSNNPHLFYIEKMILCDSSAKHVNIDINKPFYINKNQVNYINHYQWKSLDDWIVKCNSCNNVLDNGEDKKKFRIYSKWNVDNISNKPITFNCVDNYMLKYKYELDYYYKKYNNSNYIKPKLEYIKVSKEKFIKEELKEESINKNKSSNIIDNLIKKLESHILNLNNEKIIQEIISYDIYDKNVYRKFNIDLRQLDDNKLYNHYINNAKKEKRIYCISPLFNDIVNDYKEFNDDLKNLNFYEIYNHFINNAKKENRLFKYDKEFDKKINKYSQLYPEFKNNKYKLYEFYIKYLNLLPNDFNVKNYKLINPTLCKYLKTDSDFIKHYINNGIKENNQYKLLK